MPAPMSHLAAVIALEAGARSHLAPDVAGNSWEISKSDFIDRPREKITWPASETAGEQNGARCRRARRECEKSILSNEADDYYFQHAADTKRYSDIKELINHVKS